MRTSGVRYIVFSKLTTPPPDQLRSSPPFRDPLWRRFLQIPPSMPKRIGELARKITRGRRTIYDKVIAVRDYLRSNYPYTLKLTHDPRLDPVDEFLFVTRRGHCEYFASAMTLLLRTLKIHARNVNGFAGGEWNQIGKYTAVRQGDAHAWVEVLFANVGWVTFDPTPSGASAPRTSQSWVTKVRQFWDTLRLRWFRYVVEYDLGKQISLFRSVSKLASPSGTGEGWIQRNWRQLLAGFVALFALVILLRRWRRWRTGDPVGPGQSPGERLPATALYQRMLRVLARGGHAKPASTTPKEFAALLGDTGFVGAGMVERLTGCYYQLRYAGVELTEGRLREFKDNLTRLQSSIETQKRAG
jgi:hypothetical protein